MILHDRSLHNGSYGKFYIAEMRQLYVLPFLELKFLLV